MSDPHSYLSLRPGSPFQNSTSILPSWYVPALKLAQNDWKILTGQQVGFLGSKPTKDQPDQSSWRRLPQWSIPWVLARQVVHTTRAPPGVSVRVLWGLRSRHGGDVWPFQPHGDVFRKMIDFLDCTTLYSFPPSYLVANQGLEIVGFSVDYGLPRWWFEPTHLKDILN